MAHVICPSHRLIRIYKFGGIMRVYLVDFENVHYEGLSGVLSLTQDDQVYIFYSNNGKRLTFELHQQIMQSPARFAYFEAAVGGKNALDHQLSSYLGFLLGSGNSGDYYIVSKDQGYRHLIRFWQEQKEDLSIRLIENLQVKEDKVNIDEPTMAEVNTIKNEKQTTVREVAAIVSTELSMEQDNHFELAQTEVSLDPSSAADGTNKETHTSLTTAKTSRRNAHWNKNYRRGNHKTNTEKTEPPCEKEMEIMDALLHKNEAKGQCEDKQETATPKQGKRQGKGRKSQEENSRTAAGSGKDMLNTNRSVKPKKLMVAAEGSEKKQRPVVTETAILEVLPEAAGSQWLPKVVKYANNAANKADLYNKIRSLLGQKEGSQVYKALRKFV